MVCNTAIFYDIENLLGVFSGKSNTVLNLDEIYRRILEMEGVHGVSIQRAYADWALPLHRNLRNSVLQVGIEPVQIFNTNPQDRVKNAADVSLIIDAVDLISKHPEIENYVIASGDGIFAFLAKKLHEQGKRVIGCGFDKITNNIFRNACDYFISLEKSDSSITATSSNRKNKFADMPAQAAKNEAAKSGAAKSGEVKVPRKFPKTKYSEAVAKANIPIWHDSGDSSGCFHTVRQIIEALFVDATKDMPGLEVSVFNIYVKHYLPGFKVTRHGFKRVGEFMRFMMTGSPYCVYSDKENVLLIAPRSQATGAKMEDVKGLVITSSIGSKYSSVFGVPEGEPFIYSISPVEDEEKVPAKRGRKPQTQTAEKTTRKYTRRAKKAEIPESSTVVEGPFRKWVKTQFDAISTDDSLPLKEVRKLTDAEYSKATFGISVPIFREIETKSNLTEQRTVDGRVKYWRDSFRFNGRTYIIFKEWIANLHQARFLAWLDAHKK